MYYIKCNGPEFRELMLEAHRLGMTEGESVFVFIRIFEGDTTGNMSWNIGDNYDQVNFIIYYFTIYAYMYYCCCCCCCN